MSIPIDHHFNPIFYLKSWAKDGRVTRYYRPRDVVVASPIAPKNTGYEPHLYTIQGIPLERQAFLETDFFQPVDTSAAEVHRILLAGGLNQLTNQQRVDWARFMMSIQLRNPFGMGELSRLADKNMRENLCADNPDYKAKRKPDDPEDMYGWMLKYQPQTLANAYKHMLPRLIDHEGLGHYLINMHWATIGLSEASHTLLTGDRPFIHTHGWKNPLAVLLFPISPRCLFIATNGQDQTTQVAGKSSDYLVRYVNDQVVKCAVDSVIGIDGSQLRFVENRLRRLDDEPVPGPIGKGRPGCPD